MTTDETVLRSLFSQSRIMPGSKRLSIGQNGKTPPEMVQTLVKNPAAMSAALHELAHFHSLVSPLGIVLTTRALLRGHFLTETMHWAQEGGKDVAQSMVKYVHSAFQLERLLAAYEPLLEGIAVFFQTSFPCTDLDDLARPLQTLYEFGGILSMLDPDLLGDEVPDHNRLSQGILDSAYDVLKQGAAFPFDGSDHNLATELELAPGDDTLPYFMGHSYVRGIQTRVSQVLEEYECPEVFFHTLLRLLWAKRTGPKHYDLRSNIWVDMVYGWNYLFRRASNQRIAAIRSLPDETELLEWLLDEGVDEETTPVARIDNIADFLRTRIPEWNAIVKSETDMVDALPNIVLLTHMMNLSDQGACRLVGRIQPMDQGTLYVLRVSDRLWWMRTEEETLATLGIAPADVPLLSDRKEAPAEGVELALSSYVTEGELGLGQSILSGRPRHFLFWLSKMDDLSVGSLMTVRLSTGLKRAVLVRVPKDDFQAIFRIPAFRMLLELESRRESLTDTLASSLGWEGLRESMQENQQKQDAALQKIRTLWTECILVDLLGNRGRDLAATIVMNRMRDAVLDISRVRKLLTAAYSAPALLTGPGVDFTLEILRQINEQSVEVLGHPAFSVNSKGGVRYMGLWGGHLVRGSI